VLSSGTSYGVRRTQGTDHHGAMGDVVIIASCERYRLREFITAASTLRRRPVVASDAPIPIEDDATQLQVDLGDPEAAGAHIAERVPGADAVVAIDDSGVEVASVAAGRLGLTHNLPAAVAATRDKLRQRQLLAAADVAQPEFAAAEVGAVPAVARDVGFPAVIKPVGLSASRGVIRVDGREEAERAEPRIRAIVENAGGDPRHPLLIEEYIPGTEVVVEGLLTGGTVEVLAVIDKPDPLEGPFFEETMFVTPSRLPADQQRSAIALAAEAVGALGLTVGPIHAEIRLPSEGGPRLIEIAARSIGGLCGRSLTFGILGESLETLIIRNALGEAAGGPIAQRSASGVLMLPIPATGTLTDVDGIEFALAIEGVDGIEITVPLRKRLAALPEGDRYLGFVFASGLNPDDVEATLREVSATLVTSVDGEDV